MNPAANTSKRILAVAALAFLGLLISLYQTHHFFDLRSGTAAFDSLCSFGGAVGDCEAIALSPYAELLPGFPLSGLAAGAFLATLLLALVARNAYWRREAVRGLLVLTGVSVAFSLIYLYIMFGVIGGLCTFCLIVDGINIANLVLVLSLKPESLAAHKPDKSKWKTLLWVTGGSVGAVALLTVALGQGDRLPANQIDLIADRTMRQAEVSIDLSGAQTDVGPENAPVTIVKFSDFQCPACRQGAYSVHPVIKRFEGKVRFVQKQFPLNSECNRKVQRAMHPAACLAARAAVCAERQGKFEEVYESLFEHQSELSPTTVKDLAARAGADPARLAECMKSDSADQQVGRDIEQGIQLGVSSTPTFFINGRKVGGAYPTPVWVELVERILDQEGA